MNVQLLFIGVLLASWFGQAAAQEPQHNQLTEAQRAEGWVLMFDGRSTDGWMGVDGKPLPVSHVQQESLNPHPCNYMLVYSQPLGDFVLRLEFKISPKCNSGVFIRTSSLTPRPGKDVGFNGIEIAIDDTQTAGFHDTGAIYDLVPTRINAMKAAGQWNQLQVTCQGSKIEVVLNGQKVSGLDLDEWTQPHLRPDGSPHKFDVAYKNHPRRGYIGLQDHGADCWYRNLHLRLLDAAQDDGNICRATATAEPTVRFNRDVLPILADNCFDCHGFDSSKRQAGLRLDIQSGGLQELESGQTAIAPGDPGRSELWARVTAEDAALRMPPVETGRKLSDAERNTLKQWIEQGALYEPHWAYVPPVKEKPPLMADAEQPVDSFVRARLDAGGIEPSPEADRETLMRRLTLDLTGLPPTPLEVDAFVRDGRPDAFARAVDRLLQSPQFGERWAGWWLDLSHHADSDGYLQDFIRPVAWRFRQWVVEALNRDMPFDQFTIEQLAGDLLPDATVSQRMGTGFLRGTLSNREGGADLEEFRVHQVIDRTVTVGTTWLALTIGCAQCHDHKFDAISQREFYQLYGFFNVADEVNFDAPLASEQDPWEAARPKYERQRAELLDGVAERLAELQADWEQRLLRAESHASEDFYWERQLELIGLQWGQNLGEGQLEGLGIIKTPLHERTKDQQQRLLDYFLRSEPTVYSEQFKEQGLAVVRAKLDALADSMPRATRAPGMMASPVPRTTSIHLRGDFRRSGERVSPGAPAVLPPLTADDQFDRLALARWLVSPQHPLTSRVVVNRLWQELFGRGLVASSENFGVRGDRPSHPELLDWLAMEFVRDGWSIKSILRRIVLSQTYRQSSAARPELVVRDPLNQLLAKQARLRLSAEAIRDSALAVGGLLDRTVGGASVKPPQPESVSREGYRNTWDASTGGDRYRRGLYTFRQRTSPFAQLATFDLPDTSRSCTRRERTNTPLQAMNLLNDPAFWEAAGALAARVQEGPPGSDLDRLTHAYGLALARRPTREELERLQSYLQQQRAILDSQAPTQHEAMPVDSSPTHAAWTPLASVLLNLDEFIHRE